MGMNEDFRTYHKRDRTKNDIEKLFACDQQQSACEDGHSYSGQIGGMPFGINWISNTFESCDQAENHIMENHEKGDEAMGAEFPDGFIVGGWCSS